jgi:hypothetical protein
MLRHDPTLARARRTAVSLAMVAMHASACSSATDGGNGSAVDCKPRATRACIGAESCGGTQACETSGTWGPCECKSTPVPDATPPSGHEASTNAEGSAPLRVPPDGGPHETPDPAAPDDALPAGEEPIAADEDAPRDVFAIDGGADTAPPEEIPTTCAQADMATGCCSGSVVYYCLSAHGTPSSNTCASGQVCGWDSSYGFYDCVPPPGGPDPSGYFPKACE